MNPMNLLQLKPALERFRANHPKLLDFIRAVGADESIGEGAVIELTITDASGKSKTANIKVLQSDMELLAS